MKFFTIEWWCGLQKFGDYDPSPEYQRHIATIRERLPKGLLALQESISIHDANLRLLEYDRQGNTLTLKLDSDDGAGGLRQFVMRYVDVTLFRTLSDPELGLPGPHGYGDLGYHEADITADDNFEHRLLFSTGIEFQIVFRDFELDWQDVK